jgi:hypothetical protein
MNRLLAKLELKLALQTFAVVMVMVTDLHLATSGRPVEAMVITVAVVIIGL